MQNDAHTPQRDTSLRVRVRAVVERMETAAEAAHTAASLAYDRGCGYGMGGEITAKEAARLAIQVYEACHYAREILSEAAELAELLTAEGFAARFDAQLVERRDDFDKTVVLEARMTVLEEDMQRLVAGYGKRLDSLLVRVSALEKFALNESAAAIRRSAQDEPLTTGEK